MLKNYRVLVLLGCLGFLVCASRDAVAGPAAGAPSSRSLVALIVNVATIEATCGNNNGTIIVLVPNGTAPYQYSINGGATWQANDTFHLVGPGTYPIAVIDAASNTGTASAAISNLPGPTISATATTASCPNNDGSITVSGVGGTSPYSYSIDGTTWQSGAVFPGLASGNYTATIRDNNGCLSPKSVSVPLTNNLTIGAGNDTTICQGTSATLTGLSNGNVFSWAPSAGLSNPASPDPVATPATTTQYALTVTWGLCQKEASVTVTVNAAPVAGAGPDTTICPGKSIRLSGSGGVSYAWSPVTYLDQPSAADPVVNDPDPGSITYSLMVTDQNGCHSLQDAHTTVTVKPTPLISAGNDTSVLVNQSIGLQATDLNNSDFTQYAWSPAAGLNNPSIQDPVATLEETTTYTVTATAAGGCEGTASITIKVFTASDLYVPTAFSPNGDGHNDLLHVIPIGIRELSYFAVYNRNGQRVFYTTDPGQGWDGTVNGQAQGTGVYVWMTGGIDYRGARIERKGTVVLVR